MNILALLVFLIIIGVLFWAVRALGAAFGIPAPVIVVIQVILVVLSLLWILQALGVGTGLPTLRLN